MWAIFPQMRFQKVDRLFDNVFLKKDGATECVPKVIKTEIIRAYVVQ